MKLKDQVARFFSLCLPFQLIIDRWFPMTLLHQKCSPSCQLCMLSMDEAWKLYNIPAVVSLHLQYVTDCDL